MKNDVVSQKECVERVANEASFGKFSLDRKKEKQKVPAVFCFLSSFPRLFGRFICAAAEHVELFEGLLTKLLIIDFEVDSVFDAYPINEHYLFVFEQVGGDQKTINVRMARVAFNYATLFSFLSV